MKKYLKYIISIIVIFVVDLCTKTALLHFLAAKYGAMIYDHTAICSKCNIEGVYVPWEYIFGQHFVWLSKFFNVLFDWNTGASFSMFRSLGVMAPFVIVLLTAAIISYLLYYLFKRSDLYERLPLAMIIGGALGNLADRARFGAVVDFIQMHIGGLYFPAIFNVGDIFITLGVCLYIINWLINKRCCFKQCKSLKDK
ncbi:MAG: signal peptidase II [Alphaproteobacteria bacterium]|nr:signal peptidase II [Alphaproteobacteria bacterium]